MIVTVQIILAHIAEQGSAIRKWIYRTNMTKLRWFDADRTI